MRPQLLFAAFAAVLLAAGAHAACAPGKEGCEKCDKKTGKCLKCRTYGYSDEEEWPAYGLTRNGTCTKCQLPEDTAELCVRCNGDAPSRCIECDRYEVYEQGVYLKRDGTCAPCPNGCDRCSRFNGTCEACLQGYGLVNGKCERCSQEDCVDCSGNASRCKLCKQFAILMGSTCKRCEDLGVPFCYECKKDRKGRPVCAICGQEGYGLKNGRCVKCLPNCRECSDDATKCTSCSFGDVGGVFMKGKCKRCSVLTKGRCDFCQLRKGKLVCTGCKPGLGLRNGKCVPCKQRSCATCGDNYNNCMECKPGYTLAGTSQRGTCRKDTAV